MSTISIDPNHSPTQYISKKNASLSTIEQRIVNMEKEGKTVEEIAKEMDRSSRAIQMLMYNIRSKLSSENKE